MKKYKYIFFDLFDTLIDFDYSKLPQISIHGEKHNSTSELVYEVFNKSYADISFEHFYKPFVESYTDFQELKKKEFREYPNQRRWHMLFDKLNLDHKNDENNLLTEMTEAHMAGLVSATTFSETNHETLHYLQKKGYLFAMISNFDYAPTAYDLIDKYC